MNSLRSKADVAVSTPDVQESFRICLHTGQIVHDGLIIRLSQFNEVRGKHAPPWRLVIVVGVIVAAPAGVVVGDPGKQARGKRSISAARGDDVVRPVVSVLKICIAYIDFGTEKLRKTIKR